MSSRRTWACAALAVAAVVVASLHLTARKDSDARCFSGEYGIVGLDRVVLYPDGENRALMRDGNLHQYEEGQWDVTGQGIRFGPGDHVLTCPDWRARVESELRSDSTLTWARWPTHRRDGTDETQFIVLDPIPCGQLPDHIKPPWVTEIERRSRLSRERYP